MGKAIKIGAALVGAVIGGTIIKKLKNGEITLFEVTYGPDEEKQEEPEKEIHEPEPEPEPKPKECKYPIITYYEGTKYYQYNDMLFSENVFEITKENYKSNSRTLKDIIVRLADEYNKLLEQK